MTSSPLSSAFADQSDWQFSEFPPVLTMLLDSSRTAFAPCCYTPNWLPVFPSLSPPVAPAYISQLPQTSSAFPKRLRPAAAWTHWGVRSLSFCSEAKSVPAGWSVRSLLVLCLDSPCPCTSAWCSFFHSQRRPGPRRYFGPKCIFRLQFCVCAQLATFEFCSASATTAAAQKPTFQSLFLAWSSTSHSEVGYWNYWQVFLVRPPALQLHSEIPQGSSGLAVCLSAAWFCCLSTL